MPGLPASPAVVMPKRTSPVTLYQNQEKFYGRHYTLSNLTLLDMMVICARDPVLKEVVGDFFHFAQKHEITVTIDRTFLGQFPVDQNRDMYTDFGEHTRSLTLDGCPEDQLNDVMIHFPKVSRLQWQNLFMASNKVKFTPDDLQAAILINCSINREYFNGFLRRVGKTLQELRLDNVLCEFPISGESKYLELLPQLKTLSLKRMRVACLDFSITAKHQLETLILVQVEAKSVSVRAMHERIKLKHLEIETTTDIFLSGDFPALETLILNCGQSKNRRNHLATLHCEEQLKVLEYRMPGLFPKDLARFKNLKRATICSEWWAEKHQLASGQDVEVICQPPKEGYTLEKTLHSDLLRKIVSYLSLEDVLNASKVFPSLLALIGDQVCLNVDPKFLQRFPPVDNEELFQNLGESVKVVKVAGIKEDDFLFLMDRFKAVRHLLLEGMLLAALDEVPRIPKVKQLTITACSRIEEGYWRKLFEHLSGDDNTGLRTLIVEEPNYPLDALQNVSEFTTDYYADATKMRKFLEENKLRKLTLTTRFREPFLELSTDDGDPVELEKLEFVGMKFEQITELLKCLDAEKLRILRVSCYSNKGHIMEQLGRFANLQELYLETAIDWTAVDLQELRMFSQLRILQLDGVITEIVLVDLIRALPHLEELQLGTSVELFSVGLLEKLRELLRETNRPLKVVKEPMVCWNL